MLYRTPVLFGTTCCFRRIGNHSVRVTAKGTVQLFYAVQVSEAMPVDNNVISASDALHSPGRETYGLKQGNGDIQKEERDDETVHRRSDNHSGKR